LEKKKNFQAQELDQNANDQLKEKFIDIVFNNPDFWMNVQADWNNSILSSTQSSSGVKSNKSTKNTKKGLVVVVFDEARGLQTDENPDRNLFLAIRRSLADVYGDDSLNVHMFGVFMDTSSKTENFSPSMAYDPSARVTQGYKLFDPYLLPGMNDVRYDDKQDWLEEESIVGLGRPLWTTTRRSGSIEGLLYFARTKLLATPDTKFDNNDEARYRQDIAVLLCRLGLFLSPVSLTTSSLVADHMATVYACDKATDSMLVSYFSEPVQAFGAMMEWKKRGLDPLLKSMRSALIRGLVNEGTLGEISAMILLLNSMDELNAGLGWSNVHDFLEKLALVDNKIKKELGKLIPKESELNFNHFVQWFDRFDPSDLHILLKRRAACILPRNTDGTDLLIPFFIRHGEEIEFGAILVQVKNCLQASDTKHVGRKLFVSSVFQHWDENDQDIPIFRVVLELGLSRANKEPESFPMPKRVDLVDVRVSRDKSSRWEEGETAFIITSSSSHARKEKNFDVSEKKVPTIKKGRVKFLRLGGMAGVPWMDKTTYDGFIELLEGPSAPRTMPPWTEVVNSACSWKGQSFLFRAKT
jgi:hypothetical protein